MDETNELQKAIDNIQNNNANFNVAPTDAASAADELEAQIQSQMGTPPVPPIPDPNTMPEAFANPAVPEVALDATSAPTPEMAPEATFATPTAENIDQTVEDLGQPAENPNLAPRAMAEEPATEPEPSAEPAPSEGLSSEDDIPVAPIANELETPVANEAETSTTEPTPENTPADDLKAKKAAAIEESMMNDIPEISDAPTPGETPVDNIDTAKPEQASSPEEGITDLKAEMMRDLFPLMDKVEMAPEQKYEVIDEMIETTGDKTMIVKAYDEVKNFSDDTKKAEALLHLINLT